VIVMGEYRKRGCFGVGTGNYLWGLRELELIKWCSQSSRRFAPEILKIVGL